LKIFWIQSENKIVGSRRNRSKGSKGFLEDDFGMFIDDEILALEVQDKTNKRKFL
jgi:hypothetical protein